MIIGRQSVEMFDAHYKKLDKMCTRKNMEKAIAADISSVKLAFCSSGYIFCEYISLKCIITINNKKQNRVYKRMYGVNVDVSKKEIIFLI
jgi:hypothetical protein